MDQTNCQTVIEQRLSASGQTDPADVWSHVDWVHGELLITCKAIIGTKVGWTPKRVQTEVCLATAQAAVSCVSRTFKWCLQVKENRSYLSSHAHQRG